MTLHCNDIFIFQDSQSLSIFFLIEILVATKSTFICFLDQEIVEVTILQTMLHDLLSVLTFEALDEVTDDLQSLWGSL